MGAAVLCFIGIAAIGYFGGEIATGSEGVGTRLSLKGKSRALSLDEPDSKRNTALIVIKPHAATDLVLRLLQKRLRSEKISILRRGVLNSEMAPGALMMSSNLIFAGMTEIPDDLRATEEGKAAFLAAFGKTWSDALDDDICLNGDIAISFMDLTPQTLYAKWAKLELGKSLVKITSDTYVGKIDDVYVINGHAPALLNSYVEEGQNLRYLEVAWKSSVLSYANFTSSVIGGGHEPAKAEASSVRRHIYQNWQQLGLHSEPSILYNSIVASTSPFHAWVDTTVWLQQNPETHSFFLALEERDVAAQAQSLYPHSDLLFIYKGKQGTLSEHVAGLDRAKCLDVAAAILKDLD